MKHSQNFISNIDKLIKLSYSIIDTIEDSISVSYIYKQLSRISEKEYYSYGTNEYLEINNFKNIKETKEYHSSIFCPEEKLKENYIHNLIIDNNFLIILEYFKTLLYNFNFNDIPSEWQNTTKTKNFKNLEKAIDDFIKICGFEWLENSPYYELIKEKEFYLLQINSITSNEMSNIEWRDEFLKYIKVTHHTTTDYQKFLRSIQTTAEKHRDKIKVENETVEKLLFSNLNNLNIRHALGSKGNLIKVYGDSLFTNNEFDNEKYNVLLKKTVELFLLAMIIIDN